MTVEGNGSTTRNDVRVSGMIGDTGVQKDVPVTGDDALAGGGDRLLAGDTSSDYEDQLETRSFEEALQAAAYRRPRGFPLDGPFAGLRRAWFSIFFLPAFALFGTAEVVRELSYRFRKHQADEQPKYVVFRRHPKMPRERRSVADVVGELRRLPFQPKKLSTHVAFFRAFGADGLGMLLNAQHSVSSLPHLYPGVFKPRLFDGAGGVKVAGLQAMHESRGPALIICHGLLTSKNFDYIRQVACRAYSRWGFHVIAIDLRNFGQSGWTTDAPSTAGYMEGLDVVGIARMLKQDARVTSVGCLGYSLGGATVLNAAHHVSVGDDNPIDGGVLSVCAPTDMREAVTYVSQRPGFRHPFFGLWLLFQTSLRSSIRQLGVDPSIKDWPSLAREVALPYYGIDEDTFFSRASAVNWAGDITVPVLALHAEDDFVVPVEHARALEQVARDNDNVEVIVVESGNHCSFPSVDSRWINSVMRRWFEYWATEPPRAG